MLGVLPETTCHPSNVFDSKFETKAKAPDVDETGAFLGGCFIAAVGVTLKTCNTDETKRSIARPTMMIPNLKTLFDMDELEKLEIVYLLRSAKDL